MSKAPVIHAIFPCPVYMAQRDTDLSRKEEKEIEKIVKEGMYKNVGNSTSNNSDIFNGKLKHIKQFCEQHIEIYVKKIISSFDKNSKFYITQSWLNITKPGEFHHEHSHRNSIISGVFYISTKENDCIIFKDPNYKIKEFIQFEQKEINIWNNSQWIYPVNNNDLILFPSWLEHFAPLNRGNTDRISLAFNIFAKGVFGGGQKLNRLIL